MQNLFLNKTIRNNFQELLLLRLSNLLQRLRIRNLLKLRSRLENILLLLLLPFFLLLPLLNLIIPNLLFQLRHLLLIRLFNLLLFSSLFKR
ncbi:hypothetical protein Hanom_Chr14g01310331 [Helianthus anomalus]